MSDLQLVEVIDIDIDDVDDFDDFDDFRNQRGRRRRRPRSPGRSVIAIPRSPRGPRSPRPLVRPRSQPTSAIVVRDEKPSPSLKLDAETVGKAIKAALHGAAAFASLPDAPTPSDDPNTNLVNLMTQQENYAIAAKRAQQLHVVGNFAEDVAKIVLG